MVAMGTSFSDQAWGLESAVYRVTGVLTVVGGWFMTAFIAFAAAFVFANIIHYLKVPGFLLIIVFAAIMIRKNHKRHKESMKEKEEINIFNLKKISDAQQAASMTFEHVAYLLREIRESLDISFDALFAQDVITLNRQRKKVKQMLPQVVQRQSILLLKVSNKEVFSL